VVDSLRGGASPSREEARALLVLDKTPGVGLVRLGSLVRRFGSAAKALRASPDAFRAGSGGLKLPTAGAWDEVDEALGLADRLGMEVRTWGHEAYPKALLNLHDPPPVLFLRGRSELLDEPAITVIGARRATGRSRDVAERLGHGLAHAGWCVASGMALGIDGAAHRGALLAEGDTIAVLGRGADQPYPPSHGRLFRDILDRGLVVSEFAPGTPPLPHHFPRRNRILAALSRAIVVVEAGARSGALITVDHALDLGLDVWAVPGPIDLPACEGSNRLLGEGARPLLSVASFLEELGGSERPAAPRPDGPAGEVLSELAGEPLNVDQLASRLSLSAQEVMALLTDLELRGVVRRMPGMRFGVAA
jgi:DNA processing protein